jgi:hypothetical protein
MYLYTMWSNHCSPLEAARIRVEDTHGPILMISGEDDRMWPGTHFSDKAIKRLESKDFQYASKHLSYPGCGHVIWVPYCPLPPTHTIHPVDHNDYTFGGNPKDNAAAMVDSWPQVLQFLMMSLTNVRTHYVWVCCSKGDGVPGVWRGMNIN